MKVDVYRDHGKVDRSRIESWARKRGVIFPSTYVDLIGRHDGLRPKSDSFSFNFMGKTDWRDISFCGFGDSVPLDIEKCQQDEACPEGIVVIGVSANGDYICFDYSKCPESNNPPVVVMFHDFYDADDKMTVIPAAPSFADFVRGLKDSEDE